MIKEYKVPLLALFSFTLIGVVMFFVRDIRYFFLFAGIGFAEFNVRILVIKFPQHRQLFRLIVQSIIGGFLLLFLGFVAGVNFQYSQVIYDMMEGVVTGALIQLIIARFVLPFVLGNAFCSRACWTGVFFELTNTKRCKDPVQRNEYVAWGYLILTTILSIVIAIGFVNPSTDEQIRKLFIAGEVVYILFVGYFMTYFMGSRAYCRILCPFITISGLVSRWSFFKITPTKADDCTGCKKCNRECPMLIDVKQFVVDQKPIDHRLCILCERCVSSCDSSVLMVSNWKK